MADVIFNASFLTLPACVDGHVNTTPLYIKVVAAITCVLSMCGALLIIFSYICFKEMRTKAREILVHISVADFIVSCANFIGIAVDFNHLLAPLFSPHLTITPYLETVNGFCVAQAFFSMFGGLGSILWTTAMAVYFYLRVMSTKQGTAQYSVYASYVLCYGGSLLMTAWFTATKRLGHTPVGGSGWCSLIITKGDGNTDHFTLFFGGTLWLYFTFILLPILCVSLLIKLKLQVKHSSIGNVLWSAEVKLVAIPIVFIVLRFWSFLLVEMTINSSEGTLSCTFVLTLLFLAGIGDSGQGFFNAIIFCAFNKRLRHSIKLIPLRFCWFLKERKDSSAMTLQSEFDVEDD